MIKNNTLILGAKSFGTKAMAGALTMALCVSVCACGAQSNASNATSQEAQSVSQSEAASESASTKTTNPEVIGETGSDATKVKITNGLGKDVKAFQMRKSGDETWTDLLKEGELIASNASVELGYVASQEPATYDFLLTCSDDTKVQIDGLALDAMNDLTLMVQDGVGYVTYKDANGNDATTKAEEAPAAQQATTAEQVPTNSENSNGTVANDYYEQPSYEQNYVEPTYEESYTAPAAEPSEVAQNTDACMGDVVLR